MSQNTALLIHVPYHIVHSYFLIIAFLYRSTKSPVTCMALTVQIRVILGTVIALQMLSLRNLGPSAILFCCKLQRQAWLAWSSDVWYGEWMLISITDDNVSAQCYRWPLAWGIAAFCQLQYWFYLTTLPVNNLKGSVLRVYQQENRCWCVARCIQPTPVHKLTSVLNNSVLEK